MVSPAGPIHSSYRLHSVAQERGCCNQSVCASVPVRILNARAHCMQHRYHDYTWRAAVNVLSAESISTIYELAASIDDAIRINGWQRLVAPFSSFSTSAVNRSCFRVGCFVRLCGRSPKDGEPLNRQAVWSDYIRTLQSMTGYEPGSECSFDETAVDANSRLRAITHASARSFRCHCGNDVMSLLLTSERVHRCR